MKTAVIILLAVLSLSAGCRKKADTKQTGTTLSTSLKEPSADAMKIAGGKVAGNKVLLEVDGKKLTVGDASLRLDYKMRSVRSQFSEADYVRIKASRLKNEADQFIYTTVLLKEADSKGIKATQAEQDRAIKQVAAQFPAGTDINKAMEDSAWGKDNLINEMVNSIKINKLLAPLKSKQVPVTQKEIKEFYSEHKKILDEPEKVRARHILIDVPNDAKPEVRAEKKKHAEEIRRKIINDGANFADMAIKHSACASKAQGGDLGFFIRHKRMAKPFRDAAFSMKIGETSPVVETNNGYHIIQVTARKEASPPSDKKLINIVSRHKREKLVKEYIEDLKSKAEIKFHFEL